MTDKTITIDCYRYAINMAQAVLDNDRAAFGDAFRAAPSELRPPMLAALCQILADHTGQPVEPILMGMVRVAQEAGR